MTKRVLAACATASLLIAAACSSGGPDSDSPAPEPGVTQEPVAMREPAATQEPVVEVTASWPMANHDLANTRAADSTISSANVASLELAWSFVLTARSAAGAAASNPLIDNGVVYFQDLRSNLLAFDLETGAVIWETGAGLSALGPNGPALSDELVFAVRVPREAFAVERDSGREVWSTTIGPTGSIQPLAYDGQVFVSAQPGGAESGYSGGTSGILYALDQQSGAIAWSFQVVEEGFWGNPEINSGGGVWFPPALDADSGQLFWGTGNAAPFPGTTEYPNGASRPGPNLYANSLLGLDATSGELTWHHQARPHDLFDLDFQASPILTEVEVEGQTRRLAIGSGKLGRVVALDRDDGTVVWDVPVGAHQNDEVTAIPPGKTLTVFPGVIGGVTTPMAFAEGIVYVVAENIPTVHEPTGWGATTGPAAAFGAIQHTDLADGTSELSAIDVATGSILWSRAFDEPNFSGVTVVNDLLFTATYSGLILALDRASGAEVWSYQAPAGINAWPAVAGDYVVWPAGVGDGAALIVLRLPAGSGG